MAARSSSEEYTQQRPKGHTLADFLVPHPNSSQPSSSEAAPPEFEYCEVSHQEEPQDYCTITGTKKGQLPVSIEKRAKGKKVAATVCARLLLKPPAFTGDCPRKHQRSRERAATQGPQGSDRGWWVSEWRPNRVARRAPRQDERLNCIRSHNDWITFAPLQRFCSRRMLSPSSSCLDS